jgi:hypothetical protein
LEIDQVTGFDGTFEPVEAPLPRPILLEKFDYETPLPGSGTHGTRPASGW